MGESAQRRLPTVAQTVCFAGLVLVIIVGAATDAKLTSDVLAGIAGVGFVLVCLWRLFLASLPKTVSADPDPKRWPRYTILIALHDEAAVVGQLVRRLSRIRYPAARLQGFLILEAHDEATIRAAAEANGPSWLEVLIAPPGFPQTKPRALNIGLARATGDLITVYDAEDEPDPDQLRRAAARFARPGSARLGCVQAPLRIRRGTGGFLDRQFALEYAALFEVILPGMARLGLPFPLGGTSNHFRHDALRAVGGWDAWNVTEDADLGFRLWRHGWRLDVIDAPTMETPPGQFATWLPQRNRWLKGFMQTWGVHTRDLRGLGWRGCLGLVLTLGVSLASGVVHGPSVAFFMASLLLALQTGMAPLLPAASVVVMALGLISAWCACAIGAKRAGGQMTLKDAASAPLYWSLQSLAFVIGLVHLVTSPFVWDKTQHQPDKEDATGVESPVAAPSAGRAAA